MTMVWGIAPILGFFLSPIMGSISDRCLSALGRRRPFILTLAIGIVVGLILVPHGKYIGMYLGGGAVEQSVNSTELLDYDGGGSEESSSASSIFIYSKWAVIMTIIGTIILDLGADTVQTPSRAYLLDVCVQDDHAKALSTFTIMAGIGGFLGYSTGAINWKDTALGQFLGGNIITVFTIVLAVFLICLLTTITSFREIPLSLMEKDELLKPVTQISCRKENERVKGAIFTLKESIPLQIISSKDCDDLEKAEIDGGCDGVINPVEADDTISLMQYLKSIVIMPKSIAILCVTNLLCWMSHLCYCLYFTDFVGEAVFHGDPKAAPGSELYNLYEDGVRFGCWGMAIYALSCAMYSMTIEKLISIFGTKLVYVGGLLVFAAGMTVLAAFPTKLGVLLLSITAGIIYATLFTMPFLLIAQYHAKGSFKVKKGENIPLKQARGLGTDIAIISNMIFVAQLIVALGIGSFISLLGSTSAVIYAASFFSFLAAIVATKVVYMNG